MNVNKPFEQIVSSLYSEKPSRNLFHYTSLRSLEGIVRDRCLWATDIHYFNDAAEMRHIAQLLDGEIDRRIHQGCDNEKVLSQFRVWLSDRLPNGNMVFVTSFTQNGNLLSQWRGYCAPGKGVSFGFDPGLILRCADEQSFQVGKCIYETADQAKLVTQIVDAVSDLAKIRGEAAPNKKHPSQSYHGVFEEIENSLLHIGALVKHPSFAEEEEWRAVSSIFTNYVEAPIHYRESLSMLVPYIHFSLAPSGESRLFFKHVFLGPTPNINLSINSLSRFLAKHNTGQFSVQYCGIPYRNW